jgi:hypothetical protein
MCGNSRSLNISYILFTCSKLVANMSDRRLGKHTQKDGLKSKYESQKTAMN